MKIFLNFQELLILQHTSLIQAVGEILLCTRHVKPNALCYVCFKPCKTHFLTL